MNKVKSWEQALYTFLKPWQKRDEVIGAIVSGSYIWGTATPLSDIDVHVILSDTQDWRERGNKMVEGYLIEYFVNPIKQLRKYMEDDYKNSRRIDSQMFLFGKIIFDKTGEANALVDHARSMFDKEFKPLEKTEIELLKYAIWDSYDSLKDLKKTKSQAFNYLYYLLLDKIIDTYTKYQKSPVGPSAKLYKLLTDENFRKKYRISLVPDAKFNQLVIICIQEANFSNIEKLVEYVFHKMGGFNIDGWKIRTSVEL